jgi:hypothetical protein
MARNRKLADEAAALLVSKLNMLPTAPASMRGAMTCLTSRPPLRADASASLLIRKLRECCGAILPVYIFENAFCIRISAQIYNEIHDYEVLARAFPAALQQEVKL